jgi:hypothetical protein
MERLLGDPDYSPTEGPYYYSASDPDRSRSDRGLTVEYRNQSGAATDELQDFWMERLSE